MEVATKINVDNNELLTPLQRLLACDAITIDDTFYRYFDLSDEALLAITQGKGDTGGKHALLSTFDAEYSRNVYVTVEQFLNATTDKKGIVNLPDGTTLSFHVIVDV